VIATARRAGMAPPRFSSQRITSRRGVGEMSGLCLFQGRMCRRRLTTQSETIGLLSAARLEQLVAQTRHALLQDREFLGARPEAFTTAWRMPRPFTLRAVPASVKAMRTLRSSFGSRLRYT
jgi:hypothetical protein